MIWARRAKDRWLRVLLAIGVLCGLVVTPGRLAWADENPVSITLTSVSPTQVGTSGDLTITGTATNTSATKLGPLVVRLWRSIYPITIPDALTLTLESAQDDPPGQPLRIDPRASLQLDQLAAGQTVQFSLQASFVDGVEPLQMTSPGNAYLAGVQAVDASSGQLMGMSRVLMPYPRPDTDYDEATAVLLSTRPSLLRAATRDAPALFANDDLAGELTGRLGQLLSFAEQPGVTPVIDPLLFDELTAMADGYQVLDSAGQPVPGAHADVAAGFRTRLMALTTQGRAYRTLYANPDVSQAAAQGQAGVLTEAAAALSSTNPAASLPLAIIPPEGTGSDELLNFLRPLGTAVVLVNNLDRTATVQTGPDGLIMVATHADVFDGGPGPQPADSLPQRVGRLQSAQLLYADQSNGLTSAVAPTPVVSVVQTPEEADAELVAAPWRTREPLARLITASRAGALSWNDRIVPQPPTSQLPGTLGAISQTLQVYSDLTGTDTTARFDRLSAEAWSQGWNRDETDVQGFLDLAIADIRYGLSGDGVTLHVNPRYVLPDSNTQVPITVTNNMHVRIQGKVDFNSANPLRIDVPDTDFFWLDPGESRTILVRPRATANGQVEISAHVTSPAGNPVGSPVTFQVQETSAGRIGWMIIVASGVVLALATAGRVRQVHRERAKNAGRSADQHDEATPPEAAAESDDPAPSGEHAPAGPARPSGPSTPTKQRISAGQATRAEKSGEADPSTSQPRLSPPPTR